MTQSFLSIFSTDWGDFVIPPGTVLEVNPPRRSLWDRLFGFPQMPTGPKRLPANPEFWAWLHEQEIAAGKPVRAQGALLFDPYDAGRQAAQEGREHWENPYAAPSGMRNAFPEWYAGWCFGKQLLGGQNP